MSKANVNYVDAFRFQQLLLAAGVQITPQAGFVKVIAPNGQRMYVARTERVGRVDLAFKLDQPGFHVLGEGERFGKVETQLDFSLPEETILENFGKALEYMKALPKPEAKAKSERAKPGQAKPIGWSKEVLAQTKSVTAEQAPGAHASLVVKMAINKNTKLSDKIADKVLAQVPEELKDQYLAHFPAPLPPAPEAAAEIPAAIAADQN